MTTLRAAFDAGASRWRDRLFDEAGELDLAGELEELVSRWQQWEADASAQDGFRSATLTGLSNQKRKHTAGNLWWNKGSPPMQATLSLKRRYTNMNIIYNNALEHPLVVGSDGFTHVMLLEGKVNGVYTAADHESLYNLLLTTVLGFNLTVGYSRSKDPESLQSTHAWVAFGTHCTFPWQRELGVMFC